MRWGAGWLVVGRRARRQAGSAGHRSSTSKKNKVAPALQQVSLVDSSAGERGTRSVCSSACSAADGTEEPAAGGTHELDAAQQRAMPGASGGGRQRLPPGGRNSGGHRKCHPLQQIKARSAWGSGSAPVRGRHAPRAGRAAVQGRERRCRLTVVGSASIDLCGRHSLSATICMVRAVN